MENLRCKKCGYMMRRIRISYKSMLKPDKATWHCNKCSHKDDGEFKGCGKVVWRNDELETLNCGDPAGEWKIDNTSGTRRWIYTGFFKCKKCSQNTGFQHQGGNNEH